MGNFVNDINQYHHQKRKERQNRRTPRRPNHRESVISWVIFGFSIVLFIAILVLAIFLANIVTPWFILLIPVDFLIAWRLMSFLSWYDRKYDL